MDTRSFAFLQDGARPFPEKCGEPRWESARVCVLPVRLKPEREYWFGLNAPGIAGFRGLSGLAAAPFELELRTRR